MTNVAYDVARDITRQDMDKLFTWLHARLHFTETETQRDDWFESMSSFTQNDLKRGCTNFARLSWPTHKPLSIDKYKRLCMGTFEMILEQGDD